eukprot:403342268
MGNQAQVNPTSISHKLEVRCCIALASNNQLYSWGFTLDGALGFQAQNECQISPQLLNTSQFGQISKLVTGKHNTGFQAQNQFYVCGRNDENCLNQDPSQILINEFQILQIQEESIQEIAFGSKFFTLILTSSKKVFGIGKNSSFQLGTGTNQSQIEPKEISHLRDKNIRKIFAQDYSVAISEDGQMYVWGIGRMLIPNQISLSKIKVENISLAGSSMWFQTNRSDLYFCKTKDLIGNEKSKTLIRENIVDFSCGNKFMIAQGQDIDSSKQIQMSSNSSMLKTSNNMSSHSLLSSNKTQNQSHQKSSLSLINSPVLQIESSETELGSPKILKLPSRSVSPLILNVRNLNLPHNQHQKQKNDNNPNLSFDYKNYLTNQNQPDNKQMDIYNQTQDEKENMKPQLNQYNAYYSDYNMNKISQEINTRYKSVSPMRQQSQNQAAKTPENTYFKDKERIMKEQIQSQELQISFLKEKIARQEVVYDNEKRDLHRKVQLLEQKLQMKEHNIQTQEQKLIELKEQVQMVQSHYQNMQDVMKRDQESKDKMKVEYAKLKKEARFITEQNTTLNQQVKQLISDNQVLQESISKLSGLQDLNEEYQRLNQYTEELKVINNQAQTVVYHQEQEMASLNEKLNAVTLQNQECAIKIDKQKNVIKNLKSTNLTVNQANIKYKYKNKNLKEQLKSGNTNYLAPVQESNVKSPQNQMTFNNQKQLIKMFEDCLDKKQQEQNTIFINTLGKDGHSRQQQMPRSQQPSYIFTTDENTNATQETQEHEYLQLNHSSKSILIHDTRGNSQSSHTVIPPHQRQLSQTRSETESTFSSPINSRKALRQKIQDYQLKIQKLQK